MTETVVYIALQVDMVMHLVSSHSAIILAIAISFYLLLQRKSGVSKSRVLKLKCMR